MSITKESELTGMKKVSEAVAITLREMRNFTKPGMTTKELDNFGKEILQGFGAQSAPALTYGFPGWTCISLNNEIAHGIPSEKRIIREGDLLNIDVSAELNGFWADNGGSFVVGEDVHNLQSLVDASKSILKKAIYSIKGGVRISAVGRIIESEARKSGFRVIKNLTGHGIGRSLHEEPHEIANYYDKYNFKRFRKHSVVAIETFISNSSSIAHTMTDGWTLKGNRGGFVTQHEHTILITDHEPIILTELNEVWC
jgi:methionyl aminopeptidase